MYNQITRFFSREYKVSSEILLVVFILHFCAINGKQMPTTSIKLTSTVKAAG